MKKIILAMSACFSVSVMATGVDTLVADFQKADQDCNRVAKAFESHQPAANERQDRFDNSACYTWVVKTAMAEQPNNKNDILMAALSAAHERAESVTSGAIQGGMTPMMAVARANEILPNHRDEISRGAISAGVDPSVVTEATAAGIAKTNQ